ncbi:Spy/CpxP family protein refolding chaperone [Nitrosospira sp. Nsp5]|uniref:Protein refolding chaperone Spy/CpxP family n=1 Tax=Nitrosospira multiformis TaxID=1231 RepID=A0ABY0TET9_9PROT|nr:MULTISPECIES: Spy/CpxP family protein refolding chaperone [Nitrosospira]PTR09154.1 Spy/CpxP family protein refolding chaperone [Nitrosospira sp. Nsp5]SDQ72155.1 protein refolding chaperone Spy/CpxP family [Nitrosospira multiformis]
MKIITKISLIGCLLASSIALAGTQADTGSKKASQECHHGAHSRMGQGADGGERFLNRMTDRLKLTTEQRSSVEAVLQKSKSQMANLKEKIQTNRKALRELKQNGGGDGSQVQVLAQERGNLVAASIIQRSKIRNEIQLVLTDTQREQMKQMREEHKHGHHNKG